MPMMANADHIAELERNLMQERSAAVAAMTNSQNHQRTNEQLKRMVQQITNNANTQKQQLLKQINFLSQKNREFQVQHSQNVTNIFLYFFVFHYGVLNILCLIMFLIIT